MAAGKRRRSLRKPKKSLGYVKGQPKAYNYGHRSSPKTPIINPNPAGVCQCGCGRKTAIAKGTYGDTVKGFPLKFIAGHVNRLVTPRLSWEEAREVEKRAESGPFSEYTGVFYNKKSRVFFAKSRFGPHGKPVNLGVFTDELEAARAYDKHIADNGGDPFLLNFPDEHPEVDRTRRVCLVCHERKPLLSFTKFNRYTGDPNVGRICLDCRKKRNKETTAKARVNRVANLETRLRRFVSTSGSTAKKLGLEFDITFEFLMELYSQQGGRCALSGRLFDFDPALVKAPNVLSIDRIDSDRGYVKGNVQLLTLQANIAKQHWPQPDLIAFCCDVVEQQERARRTG